MRQNKKIKFISCINCSKFCENQDKNKIKKIINKFENEGFEEMIFCCEVLNGGMTEIAGGSPLKLGFKNSKGKIKYF